METLKSMLESGNWIFPHMETIVKKKFINKLGLNQDKTKDYSLTYLSFNYYISDKLELQIPKDKPKSLALMNNENLSSDHLKSIIFHLFKEGTLVESKETLKLIEIWISNFLEVLNFSPRYYNIINFLEFIILINNASFKGASHPHFLSSIFVQAAPSTKKNDFFHSIVHEAAHQEVFLLNLVDRLVERDFEKNLLYAPYQRKLRPPIARLHSLHALYRMLQFANEFSIIPSNYNVLIKAFKKNLISFEKRELTDFGFFLIRDVYEKFN